MSNFLPYLLKSTICLTLLYLVFRIMMRKESFFALNRMVLLSIVVISAVIPLLYLPGTIQSPVQVELLPVFAPAEVQPEAIPASSLENSTFVEQSVAQASIPGNSDQKLAFSKQQLLQYLYLAGFLFTLLLLLRGLYTLFSLFRRAKAVQMDGYRLLIIDKEIAAFSFGRYVILSQKDYEEHRQTLLAHEQAHIRLHHFFDLLLLETVRIFHWFNPAIYWLIKDLKEIHEFQADDYTLTNGIDATQYQLLIIQKGVGSQRFALANSFNHCQIKKRIAMINQPKSGKAWSWKVAAFLPLLALLLMAFGRKAENGPPGGSVISTITQIVSKDSTKQWSEADFLSPEGFIALKKKSNTSQWNEPDWSTFTMHGKTVTADKSKYSGEFFWEVHIDSNSRILIRKNHWDYTVNSWTGFQDSIRTWFDYDFANDRTKPHFLPAYVIGVPTMAPNCIFQIGSEQGTPSSDYQKFLNTIGNTILEIRGKYSKEFYKMEYSKLNSGQMEQIDIMIPLVARFSKTPQLRPEPSIVAENQKDSSGLFIEIRRDGNYINNKIYSRDDFIYKINEYKKYRGESTSYFKFTLPGFELSDYRNIELTAISKATGIPFVQNTTVDQQAIFPGGSDAMLEWFKKNISYSDKNSTHLTKKQVVVNFIVNTKGRIVNTLIIRGLNPEIDAEVLKVVSQMPAWKPALKDGLPIDADYTISIPLKYN